MILGVVADDVTGAGDLGGMTAEAGFLTRIHAPDRPGARAALPLPHADVTILDTDSRLDDPATAYDAVHAATTRLKAAGCERFFKKTCSVFRGNVGAEFDAMLDALGEAFAVIVLGFPRNGRITRDGLHYVHGQPLADSPFRSDPTHPTTRSDLVGMLASQTGRSVGSLTHEVVARGPERLRDEIERQRGQVHYLILDVVDEPALGTIARAVHDLPVLCGSSALAEPLASLWSRPQGRPEPARLPIRDEGALLYVAGSLTPQTAAQVDDLEARGVRRVILDPLRVLVADGREAETTRCVDACEGELVKGADALIQAAGTADAVRSAKQAGAALGLPPNEVARRVSTALAEVVGRVRERTELARLVVAGGDTSATVCRRLGVRSLRVLHEIRPGIPSMVADGMAEGRAATGPPPLLVLKSGSFGDADFLDVAGRHLKGLGPVPHPRAIRPDASDAP